MQRDKTLFKKCLYFINITLMLLPDWGTAPTTDAPPTNWLADANNNQAQQEQTPPANPNPADKAPAKDTSAEMRYQISRERELRQKVEADYKKLQESLKAEKPVFDEDTDPDGSKEIKFMAKREADELFEQKLKEYWLKDQLDQIKYEREMDNFHKHVDSVASEQLGKFGIKVSRDEVVSTMQQIDEKGFTPMQVAMLAKASEIMAKMKPETFAPWDGTKSNAWDRALSQEEVNANIYKQFWAFGH